MFRTTQIGLFAGIQPADPAKKPGPAPLAEGLTPLPPHLRTATPSQVANYNAGRHPCGFELPKRGDPAWGKKCGKCNRRAVTAPKTKDRCAELPKRDPTAQILRNWGACVRFEGVSR